MYSSTLGSLLAEKVLYMNDGYRTRRDQLGMPGVPILRVSEVLDGRLDPSFGDHVREELRSTFAQKTSRPGDIVVTTKGTVGRVARISADNPEFVYSPQVCFFRVIDQEVISGDWLYQWFRGPEFKRQALSVQDQTDMAAYINLADMRSLGIVIPPISEQRAIAEVLGALDDKIEGNHRLMSLLEERLQASFGVAGFDTVEASVRLSELIDVNPPRGKPIARAPYIDMASLPTSAALVSSPLYRPPKSGSRFINGDTLMARITPCLENGKVGFIDCLADEEVAVGSTEFIVLRPKAPLPSQFSYFLARSPRFSDYAIRHMSGSSGRQRCSAEAVARYPLAVPNQEELRAFASLADPAFRAMRSSLNEVGVLGQLRDVLLPKLLSGEIHVRDAEAVVGEAV